MSLLYTNQASFAGGEFSPGLQGRIDIQKYLSGLKTARNVNILPNGGVRNRPGTYFVAESGDSTKKVRLVPFVYSTGQAYILEFGHHYIRFFTADAQIQSDITQYPDWDPTTAYELGDWARIGINGRFTWGSKWLTLQDPYTHYNGQPHNITLTVNSSDTLDITASGGVSTPGSITIKLANSTASNNTAAAIQALLRTKGARFSQYVVLGNAAYDAAPPITAPDASPIALNAATMKDYSCIADNTAKFPDWADGNWEDTAGVFEVATTYDEADLFDLKFTQSADVLYIFHQDYAPRQLTRVSAAYWALGLYAFTNGPFMVMNTDAAKTITAAIPAWVTSTAYVVGDMVAQGGNNYVCAIAHTSGVFATDLAAGDWVLAPSSIVTGSGIPLTIASGITITSDHYGSLLEIIHPVQAFTQNKALTAVTQSSAPIRCGSTWRLLTSNAWTGTIEVQKSIDNGLTWTAIRSLPSSGADNYDATGDTGEQQCLIRVYAKSWTGGTCDLLVSNDSFDWHGIVRIDDISGGLVYVTVQTALGDIVASADWSEGSWSIYRGYPACGAFYLDRLVAASSKAEPQTVWFSKVGDYVNHGASDPQVDDDAFSVLLPSRTVNIVRNLEVLVNLIALTSDGEFSIGPGQNGILSYNSNEVALHTHRGTSGIDPAVVGNEMILPDQLGATIRNLIYQLAVQGYMGDNLSIVSQHLFTGYSIVQMAYQQTPDSLVWAVRSDGALLSLTYLREQEVNAWTWHDTAGLFESVAVIPNSSLGINEVWFVVKRTVDGSDVRYIERLTKRDMGTDPADYVMLDSALSYSGAPASTVSGLDHLEGKTVNALSDGNVVKDLVVASGEVTLPAAASEIHVGLPYVSDVEALRLELQDQRGTLQGRRSAIPDVGIRFWLSRGGYVKAMSDDVADPASTGTSGFDEIIQREAADAYDAAIPLKTRDYRITLNGGYDAGARVFFRQVDPLPFTILAFLPRLVPSEG